MPIVYIPGMGRDSEPSQSVSYQRKGRGYRQPPIQPGTGRSFSPAETGEQVITPAGARAISDAKYDPAGAIGSVMDDINAFYDEEAAGYGSGSYGGGGGGGGGGSGYADVIKEMEEQLADIIANRAELGVVYDEYSAFVDPISQEAIDAASKIVAEGKPALDKIAAEGQASISGSFDQANRAVASEANLIRAGQAAKKSVVKDIEGEALRIAHAIQEATGATAELGLTQRAAVTQAQADKDIDQGTITRDEEYLDLEFGVMEREMREQLKAAREAAASAASAYRSSRNAMSSNALNALNDERYAALRLGPHEAGEATSLTYLRNNISDMDYNRQQLILSTVSNAISQQVTSGNVGKFAADNGVHLTPDELRAVQGGVGAYVAGMRHQQDRDSREEQVHESNIQYGTDASGQANHYRTRAER